jgi:hypothetical protein
MTKKKLFLLSVGLLCAAVSVFAQREINETHVGIERVLSD